jgi:hypothetical protein
LSQLVWLAARAGGAVDFSDGANGSRLFASMNVRLAFDQKTGAGVSGSQDL